MKQLGIAREAVLLPLRSVRLLRRRYSSFDLAYELGLEGTILREAERILASGPGSRSDLEILP